MPKKLFISYSRDDDQSVKDLVGGLEAFGYQVWIDQAGLRLGENWWNAVLESIRDADVVVAVVSQEWLESPPCRSEWDYAAAVGRPVIFVRTVRHELSGLPLKIAKTQLARITEFGKIKSAIDAQPPAPPPDPSIPRPPYPMTWDVAQWAIRAGGDLDAEAQLAIANFLVDNARSADPRKRRRARALAVEFVARDDPTNSPKSIVGSALGPQRGHIYLVVGSVLAGAALTHLYWLSKLYFVLTPYVGPGRSVLPINLVLGCAGTVLCLFALRSRVRGARLALALSVAGLAVAVLDDLIFTKLLRQVLIAIW